MRIGVDIDNVITDFDGSVLNEMIVQDKLFRNAGIVDDKKHFLDGMFDWSKNEITGFLNDNMESIASKMKMRLNCKKYIDKLIDRGHEIFIVTHRVYPHYKRPAETTTSWLKKHNINYHKLIFSKSSDKTEECKLNNVDVMLDDRVSKCLLMNENGVNCIVMQTKYNKNDKHDLIVAKSWKNFWEIISEMEKREGSQ